MNSFSDGFDNQSFVNEYLRHGPPAFMPGHSGVLQMTAVLLREHASPDAHILVVGAGGGLEIRALANQESGFRFLGVDPAPQMLALANTVIGAELAPRVELLEGAVEIAPPGPFNAATCILVLGLIPDDGRKLELLRAIRRRLEPGAPFILVDQCLAVSAPDFDQRLTLYANYALASGVDPEVVTKAKEALRSNSSSASSERDESLIDEAGFRSRELFYRGMAWHGWIARA